MGPCGAILVKDGALVSSGTSKLGIYWDIDRDIDADMDRHIDVDLDRDIDVDMDRHMDVDVPGAQRYVKQWPSRVVEGLGHCFTCLWAQGTSQVLCSSE